MRFPQKLNVWAGILGNYIVGYIFGREFNKRDLSFMLQTIIQSRLLEIAENNPKEFEDMEMAFQ